MQKTGIECRDEIDELVVRLVSQGLTNREIGNRIYISEHTVAHRITRILRRSGLRNRVQIGAVGAGTGSGHSTPGFDGHVCS